MRRTDSHPTAYTGSRIPENATLDQREPTAGTTSTDRINSDLLTVLARLLARQAAAEFLQVGNEASACSTARGSDD